MTVDPDYIEAASACSYPRRDGNRVEALVDGMAAFERICQSVEGARASVWVTVAFLEQDIEMPGGRGGFFEVLERAAGRGIDVRVLFWSEPDLARQLADASHFPACEASFEALSRRAPSLRARWDRVPDYCHHQKSWLIDAGGPTETAFVGGINLDKGSVVGPGHGPTGLSGQEANVHDVYLELAGPSATDVHHNFVQRWNEASERTLPFGSFPDLAAASDLEFPATATATAGSARVQIARSVVAGIYSSAVASPGATSFDVAGGEASVREQYGRAVEAARSFVYLENQMLMCPKLISQLLAALERGVEVIALLPRRAMAEIREHRDHPKLRPVLDMLAELGSFERFTMAAPAVRRGPGIWDDIYVHAKTAVIDDCWATVGSTNTMSRSFRGDTELNATVWDRSFARGLRIRLFNEQLGQDCAEMGMTEALHSYHETARENAERHERDEDIIGFAVAFDPATWAD